jgi:hypothetical protein
METKYNLLIAVVLILSINQANAANITIVPNYQETTVGTAFYVGVHLDSGGVPVQFAHVEVDFPAAYASAVTVTYNNLMGGYVAIEPGSGTSTGKAIFGLALTSGIPVAVNGTLFTIQMFAPSLSNVTIPLNISNVDIMNDTINHLDSAAFNYSNGSVNVTSGLPGQIVNNQNSVTYAPLHPTQFTACNNGCDTRYPGVNVTATNVTETQNAITDNLGHVVFWMNSTINYNISFVNLSAGINKTVQIFPIESAYTICVDSSCSISFQYGNVSSNLTNYTITYTDNTSTPWSIQNLTNASLNSTIGVGSTGQGILAGIITWIVVGAGGTVTAFAVLAIMAWLGIITWIMLLFCVMTGISLFVLRGWLG